MSIVATFSIPLEALLPDAVRAAVRAELAPELARLDVAVSTRATPDDLPAAGGRAVRGVLR